MLLSKGFNTFKNVISDEIPHIDSPHAVEQLRHFLHNAADGFAVRRCANSLQVEAMKRCKLDPDEVACFGGIKRGNDGLMFVRLVELGSVQGLGAARHSSAAVGLKATWPANGGSDPGCLSHCAARLWDQDLWNEGWLPARAPICINAPCYEAYRAHRLGLTPGQYDASFMGVEEIIGNPRRNRHHKKACRTISTTVQGLAIPEVLAESHAVFVVEASCRQTGQRAVLLAQLFLQSDNLSRKSPEMPNGFLDDTWWESRRSHAYESRVARQFRSLAYAPRRHPELRETHQKLKTD